MEVTVHRAIRSADEVLVVEFEGNADQTGLLLNKGWLTGSDLGYSRDKGGPPVLRGHLHNGQVVFPGDLVLLHPDWTMEAYSPELFARKYEDEDDYAVLTDEQEPKPADLKSIPTGENIEAVNLEPIDPDSSEAGAAAAQDDTQAVDEEDDDEDDDDDV